LPRVYNHTSREQLRVLLPYLKENRIFSRLGYLIGDNISSNDKLCRLLSTYLLDNEGIEWDASHYRLRCYGHILNLADQSFFFEEAKLLTEGYQGTIDRVLPSMDVIVHHYKDAQSRYERSNPAFFQRIKASWLVFDKYYQKTDDTSVYAAALILHPSRRTQYIRKNWKKEWQKPGLASVKKLWETSYLNAPIMNPILSSHYIGEEEHDPARPVNKLGQLLQSLEVVIK